MFALKEESECMVDPKRISLCFFFNRIEKVREREVD